MGIIDNLLAKRGFVKRTEIDALKAEFDKVRSVYPLMYAAGEQHNIPDPSVYGNQADLYRKISWIAASVQILSQACAAVPFNVKAMQGEDEKDIPNHPFEVLLHKPNPLMSRTEFLEAAFSYYRLTGNGYIWLNAASESAPPDELWVIPSNQIEPVPDGNLFIKHYLYRNGQGEELELPPWEVLHLKRFNPNNLFVGLSPIEAIAEQAQGDLGRVQRDRKVYTENNGQLPAILAFADNFQDAEWQSMKSDVAQRAADMKRFMMMRNVKQGGLQLIQSALSNVEMEYLANRRFTKEEIYDLFAPGLASMLAVNATEANSKSGKATFSEFAMWPMLSSFAEKVALDILPRYGENLTGEFDDVRAKDRNLEMAEQQEYAKTHTVEEIRKKYYQDEPLGDERDKLMPVQINAQVGAGEPPEEVPAQLQNAQQPAQPPQEQPAQLPTDEQDAENAGESEPVEDEVKAEEKRWKRVARKAIKAGRPIPEFVTDIIPAHDQARIRAGLAGCKTVEEVDKAFDTAPDTGLAVLIAELRAARELLERVPA